MSTVIIKEIEAPKGEERDDNTFSIQSPASGATNLQPGQANQITIETPSIGLLHELVLYAIPTQIPIQASYATFTPTTSPYNTSINLPAGNGIQYYLELGLAPSTTQKEQYRHRILITTVVMAALNVDLEASVNPGTLSVGTSSVDFTIKATGGSGTYNFATLHTGNGPDQIAMFMSGQNSTMIRHSFSVGGPYNVTATVQDSTGGSKLSNQLTYTVVAPPPSVSLNLTPTPGTYVGPLNVSFLAIPQGGSGNFSYMFNVPGATSVVQAGPGYQAVLPSGTICSPTVTITDMATLLSATSPPLSTPYTVN